MVKVKWVAIHPKMYHAIFKEIGAQLVLFDTHSCTGNSCAMHGKPYWLAEWGFKDSPVPLILSINDDGEKLHWIARVVKEVNDG